VIRVLFIDDSVVARRMVSTALERDSDIQVTGVSSGKLGLARLALEKTDIVLLDVEMPEMDGIEVLREIRATDPVIPVVMFSSLTARGAVATLDALSAGANDYVTKPQAQESAEAALDYVYEALSTRIRALVGTRTDPEIKDASTSARESSRPSFRPSILAIGASTGGTEAMHEMLTHFPDSLPFPVVAVQHMPPIFTGYFAERLDRLLPFSVIEGADKMDVAPNTVYIAPGGLHMTVERGTRGLWLRTYDGPKVNSCRPAVDVLFASLAKLKQERILGVVLTGMGSDGLDGARDLVNSGGSIFVQDAASSVVWGMPGAIAREGLATKIAPVEQLAKNIKTMIKEMAS